MELFYVIGKVPGASSWRKLSDLSAGAAEAKRAEWAAEAKPDEEVEVKSTGFCSFETWAEVLAYVHTGMPLYYHAPMNVSPVRVWNRTVTKSGCIRIGAQGDSDAFTADEEHLSRMRRKP